MLIDGKLIAEKILEKLKPDVNALKKNQIVPHLLIILVGNNPSSLSYIKQKQKAADYLGINLTVDHQPEIVNTGELARLINKYNHDPLIHGLIVQQPLPPQLNLTMILRSIIVEKDVDGFKDNSLYDSPVGMAVLKILQFIFHHRQHLHRQHLEGGRMDSFQVGQTENDLEQFKHWLKNKKILIIGKGSTAGAPIYKALKKQTHNIFTADSKTKNLTEIAKKSEIIISAVGKSHIVRREMITKKTILIGVGLHSEIIPPPDAPNLPYHPNLHKSILKTDYEEDEISDIAAYYTPRIGGVGPVTVACLMQNVVKSAQRK